MGRRFAVAKNFAYLRRVTDEQCAFIDALRCYVLTALREESEGADYIAGAVCIVDARNHLFVSAGRHDTDEAEDIYALRSLLRPDEDTLELLPDEGRLAAVARNYF